MTPEEFTAALREAMALVNAGDGAGAKPRLEALVAARPEQPDPYAVLGFIAGEWGDAAAAETLLRQAMKLAPGRPQYQVELGRLFVREGRAVEAEAAFRSALVLAPQVAPAWAGLARALEDQRRYGDAETALRRVIERQPGDVAAHRDLAQLVWRRTQDVGQAGAALKMALAAHETPELILLKAKLLEYAGDAPAALRVVESGLGRAPSSALLMAAAAQLSLGADPELALTLARRAAVAAPDDAGFRSALCQAELAAGDAEAAAVTARAMLAADPDNQAALAFLATAQRLAGDPAYAALCDYDLVRSYRLEPPAPWSDLGGYLADLGAALTARHQLAGPPIGQSTRGGGEASLDPRIETDPAIRGFFEAVRAPIARHIAEIGAGEGPFRCRATDDFRLAGAWSVRLRSGGFHTGHVHPRGWISSAFYVALPPSVGAASQAGWLQFGVPGSPTHPPLAAEHALQPEPGLLALFPSYFWHGTAPFEDAEPRLTIAFDVVPNPHAP